MVITEGHPETWNDESWNEHVIGLNETPDWVISVRDPLPIARIHLSQKSSIRSSVKSLQAVDLWRFNRDPPTETALTICSLQTTRRPSDFADFLEPGVLRFAKERALPAVQCVTPISIDHAKQYPTMTRLQLVLFGDLRYPLVDALMSLNFEPVAYRSDPLGVDIGWSWINPHI